jgi:hypothetical protein
VPVGGLGVSPSLALVPATLDFAGELVGKSTAPLTFAVANAGNTAVNVMSLSLTGAEASWFQLVNPPATPFAVGPGMSVSVAAQFAPKAVGSGTASLDLATDDPAMPLVSETLSGIGVTSALFAQPATIDFGPTMVATAAAPRMLTVTNLGDTPIALADAALSGATPAAFTVGGLAGSLAARASAMVPVGFTAAAAMDYAATATISTTDGSSPPATVMLAGRGVSGLLAATPDNLDFGRVGVGTSAARSVVLSNQGATPVTIATLAADSPFSVENGAAGLVVAPGATSAVVVDFDPTAGGAAAGQLTATLSDGAPPLALVALSGTGAKPLAPGCSCALARTRATGGALLFLLLFLFLWLRFAAALAARRYDRSIRRTALSTSTKSRS